MKVLLDLNIIIDVALKREPFTADSAQVWNAHTEGKFDGVLAATEITNVFYILRRFVDGVTALRTVDRCLRDFVIVPVGHAELQSAATMPGKDFEDNVVIACAATIAADYIVTRDTEGSAHSPVSAISPAAFILLLSE